MTDNGAAPATTLAGPFEPPVDFPSRLIAPTRDARLGEELPIFCERCGYSLNGLVQVRCEACNVLHFACPECNHHQPINTLRPAVQRLLGRLRALGLGFIVFLKINYFGWTLFFWGVAGLGTSYTYSDRLGTRNWNYGPAEFEGIVATTLFLFAFTWGMIARMLLLRWRRGVLIGLAIGPLVFVAMWLGAYMRQWEGRRGELPSPVELPFIAYTLIAASAVWVGAVCAWGVWLSLATAFLPKRATVALIEWQRAMSAPQGAKDRTDRTTSVTV